MKEYQKEVFHAAETVPRTIDTRPNAIPALGRFRNIK
jgi:hypothetical protein